MQCRSLSLVLAFALAAGAFSQSYVPFNVEVTSPFPGRQDTFPSSINEVGLVAGSYAVPLGAGIYAGFVRDTGGEDHFVRRARARHQRPRSDCGPSRRTVQLFAVA